MSTDFIIMANNEKLKVEAIGNINDANLNLVFRTEAVSTAVYLINLSPCSGLIEKNPNEMWMNRKADTNQILVFGCKTLVHVSKQKCKNSIQSLSNM